MLKAIDSLPIDFRLVVILADLQEFSYKEIAEILECPVGTVMSRLFRGRRLLQKTLASYAVVSGVLQLQGRGRREHRPRGVPEAPRQVGLDGARRQRRAWRSNPR